MLSPAAGCTLIVTTTTTTTTTTTITITKSRSSSSSTRSLHNVDPPRRIINRHSKRHTMLSNSSSISIKGAKQSRQRLSHLLPKNLRVGARQHFLQVRHEAAAFRRDGGGRTRYVVCVAQQGVHLVGSGSFCVVCGGHRDGSGRMKWEVKGGMVLRGALL
ncbi:hypothetical protein IWX91DRAFT_347325 [Phyllosticta citricarpa]